MWTLVGIVARAISLKFFASSTSRNGATSGSREMTDDRITPGGIMKK